MSDGEAVGRLANERPCEYRAAEVAARAGISVRTFRFYRERGLIPPPRREGRVGWYSQGHLDQLHLVVTLLRKGHTLDGTAALLKALEHGRSPEELAELLGLDLPKRAAPSVVHLTPERLARILNTDITPAQIRDAERMNWVHRGEKGAICITRHVLDAALALLRTGLSLSELLALAHRVHEHIDGLVRLALESPAELQASQQCFIDCVQTHLSSILNAADQGHGQEGTATCR
ncbi:MerR family transcriptional regulator [Streptomyces sp. NPDC002343]